jgi:hypothetical protein
MAEHMVKVQRYATNGVADMTAAVRKSLPEGAHVQASTLAGICHVFDVYGHNLADALDEMAGMCEYQKRRFKRGYARMERLFGDQFNRMRDSTNAYEFFMPFRLERSGEYLGTKKIDRSELHCALTKVLKGAHGLGFKKDSDIARCAITYVDGLVLGLKPSDPALHDLQRRASENTHWRFINCAFNDGLLKGMQYENVRRAWVGELDILPGMLRNYDRLGSRYTPYEQNLALLFATFVAAPCADMALIAAKEVARSQILGKHTLRSEHAFLVNAVVEKHKTSIDVDRTGLPLPERVKPKR